jgi:hypothetical protein
VTGRGSDSCRAVGWLSLLAVLVLSACAHVESRAPTLPQAPELTATPFFPQRDFECGPAALATVLAASGVATTADGLSGELYIPDRRGTLQAEMLATARRHRRIGYPVQGLPDLVEQVRRGLPVAVLQRLGTWPVQTWHYAVVIGFDASTSQLVLRSGTERRALLDVEHFMRTWAPGGNWAFVVLKPGELPAQPDANRYLAATAAAESSLTAADRARAYRIATLTWPAQAGAHFALGNSLHAQHLDAAAEASWRMAISLQPGHAGAINNLADLLARTGRRREALSLLDVGLAGRLEPEALRPVLLKTRQELTGRQSTAAADSKNPR